MGIPMAYNTGTTNTYTEKTVKRGTIALNPGPSLAPSYNWFNGVDATATQYLIYSDTYTTGQATQANSRPTAWTTPDLSDASILALINTLPERIGQTPFTYAPVALKWLHQSGRYFLLKNNFENIVTNGLIFNLDGSWPNSYSGTSTWFDLSGQGNNGTLYNGPTFNSDSGGGISFDGADDYMAAGTLPASLQGNPKFSIGGWFKRSGTWQGGATWGIGNPGTNINSYNWSIDNSIGIDLYGNTTYNTNQTYSLTEWKHVIWTYNGSGFNRNNIIIYINGSACTGNDLTVMRDSGAVPNISNGGLTLGRVSSSENNYYGKPIIGNFTVYNRVLSPAEIMQNFYAQGPRFGYTADTPSIVTSGLTLNLDAANAISYPGSGTTWYDISNSGGKNGVLTNGTSFSAQTGGYFVFDGVDDAIIIPKNSVFFTNEWTWEGWINYISNSGDGSNYHGVFWAEGVMNTTTGDNGYQWLLTFRSVDTTSCYAHMRINNVSSAWGQTDTNALGYPMVDRWNHVVWQFKNGNTKLYVNNVKILDDNTRGAYGAGLGNSSDNANSRVFLGCRNDFGLESNFRMATARHYNRMLSESEITQNYNAQKGRFGL